MSCTGGKLPATADRGTKVKRYREAFHKITLLELSASPIWVAYSGAPKGQGKIDKAPLNPKTGGNAQNSNPSTWANRKAAEARAKSLKAPGRKPGVGVQMTDLGDGTALCGVDLDGCHGPSGLDAWAQAICDKLKTYAEVSPSGEGVKLFFRVLVEAMPAVRKAMGTEHRKTWKQGDHYGAELHLSNSYFTVTGRVYGGHGEALRLVPAADLLWLVNEAGPAFQRGDAGTTAALDMSGSGHGFRLLLDLFRAGSSEDKARDELEDEQGPAGEWWRRSNSRERERAVARAFEKVATERRELLAGFNDEKVADEDDGLDDEARALIGLPLVRRNDFGTPMMRGDKPVVNLTNAIIYLGRDLDSILPGLSHNQMTGRDEWRDGPLNDSDLALARVSLERRGLQTIGKELVEEAAKAVARFRQQHPIRAQLDGLRHDGKPRLDSWLVRLAGAKDSPYARAVGRKWLVAMVARVMRPGCKHDHMPVLIGPQGAGKSSLCRTLAGDTYFSDTLPSIGGRNQEAEKHLMGKWLVEVAELQAMGKAEAQDIKAFITVQEDKVRRAYDRLDTATPRQCVFVATTNDDEFLRDATGGRRFWPVHVGKIDLVGLKAERDQLFSEAVAAYRAGESWWMDAAFEAQHVRPIQDSARVRDSWADDVAAWLDKPMNSASDFDEEESPRNEVTVSEVMDLALNLPSGQQTMAVQKRVADVLRGLGWIKVKTHGRMIWRKPLPDRWT